MAKPISDYTVDELSAKIKSIKAEREKTASALERYEEELERRKQEVPLGVPHEGLFFVNGGGKAEKRYYLPSLEERDYNCFDTPESANKHAEMLLAWRMALVANSKSEPIGIEVLLPLFPKGWVAMDKDGAWCWYKEKPEVFSDCWRVWVDGICCSLQPFNLKPADDWQNSLMECGL